MADEPLVRPAQQRDSADLAILADAATRRLVAWLWDDAAAVGQSSFEVGRTMIRSQPDQLYHYSRWDVLEFDGNVAGGLNTFQAPPPGPPTPYNAEVLTPLNELKSIAEGTWYISVASVFPEFRGRGYGRILLNQAEAQAKAAGIDKLTLMVASFNPGALRLYERFGFQEWARRPFVPFPGSDPEGDWLLLVKAL